MVKPVIYAGEVLTRGPHVMMGYIGLESATHEAFAPGGWLRTGDLGALDSRGGLWLRGRLKVPSCAACRVCIPMTLSLPPCASSTCSLLVGKAVSGDAGAQMCVLAPSQSCNNGL